ncbi:hypothetical protein C8R44DRAFT_745922 [Mycena epipterygia]|nr:hypothetical protein C8R44DRAFT_745922 [Mycena epipterygia]
MRTLHLLSLPHPPALPSLLGPPILLALILLIGLQSSHLNRSLDFHRVLSPRWIHTRSTDHRLNSSPAPPELQPGFIVDAMVTVWSKRCTKHPTPHSAHCYECDALRNRLETFAKIARDPKKGTNYEFF